MIERPERAAGPQVIGKALDGLMKSTMDLTKKLVAGHMLTAACMILAASGCVATKGGTASAPVAGALMGAPPTSRGHSNPPTDSHADAEYYRTRALTLAKEELGEIARIDFVRFRRGRLYAVGPSDSDVIQALGRDLTAAFDRSDHGAMVEITAGILTDDQADIRAHMLRSIALRKLNRTREADFHRAVALALIRSIMASGDGRRLESAWTVFRVKEEYEIIKVLGGLVESQALASNGGRMFDVLTARRPEGSGVIRAHFDITELFAEEGRNQRGRKAEGAVQQGIAPDGRSPAAPARR